MIRRAISGSLAIFGDGGQVYKVSVPSDFTTIRITGLPQNTTIEYIETMLDTLDLNAPGVCIRIINMGTPPSVSAYLRLEGSMVGPILCEELKSGFRRSEKYAKLEAAPVSSTLFSINGTSREVDLHKVVFSWYRPSKVAVLKYQNEDIANATCNNFNSGHYRVAGKHLTCDSPTDPKFASGTENKFFCRLKNLPVFVDEQDILGAIDDEYLPDEVTVSSASYEASDEMTRNYVKALCLAIGPLESWDPVHDPAAKRVKVRVRFQEESDTLEAITQLNDKNIEILGKGKIMAQQIISVRFKVATKIYLSVQSQIEANKKSWFEHRIIIGAYPSTDVAQKFTSLKIEGEPGENFVNAKNKLENILAGTVASFGGKLIWNEYFMQPVGLSKIKQIEKDCGVVIDRDRRREQLRIYGSSSDIESAQYTLHNIVTSQVEGYAIKLTRTDFLWVSNGGFEEIVSALGKDVASIDLLSTPKKLLLAGGPENYHKAMAILNSKKLTASDIVKKKEVEDEEDCVVCWCPAETPVRTNCGHLYCLECFKHLCSSITTGDKEVSINCMVEECDVVLPLKEIEQHIPSKIFEEILEASFTSYVRRHPDEFRYCPTADCKQIYRVTSPIKSRLCAQCLVETCTSCHESHTGQSCADYKYQKQGGDAAFEKVKSELGCKDCPKCGATIEKTWGCHHIVCSGCKIHLCWLCLATFEEEMPCYDHLSARHGGVDIEEDPEEDSEEDPEEDQFNEPVVNPVVNPVVIPWLDRDQDQGIGFQGALRRFRIQQYLREL